MQHDEMIWSIVNNQFCSYKTTIGSAKTRDKEQRRHFCRHPYSVTGLCNRTSCPLANSRYATVREEGGKVSLFLKTVERAHSPKNLWEKITLSRNYAKALAQLDEHLQFFPKAQIHRNKQRLTKIHQYLLRMRKIKLKELAGKRQATVGINRKVEQREGRREKKALVAAKVEKNIEKELVERLARGTYGDIYNFPEAPYRKALEEAEEREAEEESESESEEEEEKEMEGVVEYVEDLEEEDDEEEVSSEEEEDEEEMEYMGDGKWGRAARGSGSDESESESDSEESGSGSEDEEEGSGGDEEESGSESGDGGSGSDEDEEDDGARRKKKKPSGKTRTPDKKKKRKKRGTRVEIEYEEEREDQAQMEIESGGGRGEAVAGMAW